MAKLWTFSGINSPFSSDSGYVDYTWDVLKKDISGIPDRRYASELGTTDRYDSAHNVIGFRSEKKLDREANDFASNGGGHPRVRNDMFRGKKVNVLLVAPKTTTKPPTSTGARATRFPTRA